MINRYSPPKNKRKSVPRKKIVQISSFEKTNSEPSQSGWGWQIKDLLELMHDYFKSPAFAALLTVKDVLSLGAVCKGFRKIFDKDYVKLVVRLGGLDGEIRYLFWIYQAPYARYDFLLLLVLSEKCY